MAVDKPVIAIVVPCYNEQDALPVSVPRMLEILDVMGADGLISPESYVLCCNDGSRDATWQVIADLHAADARVKGISLAHNRGHQKVLLAGLMTVRDKCDAAISIDADLQDDPHAIIEMVKLFREGDEIVYGVRSSRATDTWFKRTSAHAFYSLQRRMGVETVFDHADYRLMSNRALDLLSEYGEGNLFLRGIIPHIGLKTGVVTYERAERVAGESKYPLRKMISLAADGITSLSVKPLRLIMSFGLIVAFLSFVGVIWALIASCSGHTVAGWASMTCIICFVGGVQLICLGIIGEYIGKIYMETKQRPRYIISERTWENND